MSDICHATTPTAGFGGQPPQEVAKTPAEIPEAIEQREYEIFTLKGTNITAARAAAAKWLISKLKEQKRTVPSTITAYCK